MKNKKGVYFYILLMSVLCIVSLYSTIQLKAKATYSNPVAKEEEKVISKWGENEVYLTFDDAPGDKVTEEILQILKAQQVKGTFFIVGNRISGREKTLKNIVDDGNSIGLHSYSHQMKKIYGSSNVFIEEMDKTSDEIFKIVGIRTNVIRFPGGSKPFMTKSFLDELHAKNFKVFDWNVPVSDGINAKISPEKFYKEATNTRYFKSPLIILMHCSGENENTVKALPNIIKYYKDLGYNFKTLTMDSPEYYFRIKK